MARRKTSPGSKLFLRLKIGAVGALALTLIGVWAPVLMGSGAGGAAPEQAASSPSGDSRPRITDAEPASDSAVKVEPWPDMTLEQATAFDPLAEPQWVARLRVALQKSQSKTGSNSQLPDPDQTLRSLREEGASMVMIAGSQKSAIVGKKTLRIGDLVNGFPVVDIDSSGVQLGDYQGEAVEAVPIKDQTN